MPAWVIWVIVAGVLAIAEVLSLDLVLIMCAAAAGVAAVGAGLGAPVVAQVVLFAASALGLLFVVRPVARRHLERSTPESRMGIEGLVGRKAIVLRTVDRDSGLVKLHGKKKKQSRPRAPPMPLLLPILALLQVPPQPQLRQLHESQAPRLQLVRT